MWTFEREMDVVRITCAERTFVLSYRTVAIGSPSPPEFGRIYKIKDIASAGELVRAYGCTVNNPRLLMLQFYEAPDDTWFESTMFRPVRKTDISALRKLAAPLKSELVDA